MSVTKPFPLHIVIYITILTAIPFALLLLLELSLRLFNYGINSEPLVPDPRSPGYVTSPSNYLQLFHTSRLPERINPFDPEIRFQEKKEMNFLRGFVLGESTAAGFPYSRGLSFSNLAEKMMQSESKKVEIINLSASAMSSYYVRFTAGKLLKYKPDFLILYLGHNEYYGTISAINSNHLLNLLHLWLLDWKTAQLLDSILNPKKPLNKSLMASQWDEKRIPQSLERDKNLQLAFESNIGYVLKLYEDAGIPVYLFDPVSNLITFPPFAADENRAEYSNAVRGTWKSLILDSASSDLDNLTKSFPNQSHTYWLQATDKLLQNREFDMDLFTKAKDKDAIPFRARSWISNSLETLSKTYKNVNFIPTGAILNEQYGALGFGDKVFIDHLHFTHEGNYILGSILANLIEDKNSFENLPSLNSMDASSFDKFDYTPLQELSADFSIFKIVSDEPYHSMLISYSPPLKSRIDSNPYALNKTLLEALGQLEDMGNFEAGIQILLANGKINEALKESRALNSLFPGSTSGPWFESEILLKTGSKDIEPLKLWLEGWKRAGSPEKSFTDFSIQIQRNGSDAQKDFLQKLF